MDHRTTVDNNAARLVHVGQFSKGTLLELSCVRGAESLDPTGEPMGHLEIPARLRVRDGDVDLKVDGADVYEACRAQRRRNLEMLGTGALRRPEERTRPRSC